jgi:hypothetical protein
MADSPTKLPFHLTPLQVDMVGSSLAQKRASMVRLRQNHVAGSRMYQSLTADIADLDDLISLFSH